MNEFALSGAAIAVTAANFSPGTAVPIINWSANHAGCLDATKPNRRHGMCSIHIDEWDLDRVTPAGEFPNQYLVADVTYGTGDGNTGGGRGGEFTVGLTRGTVIAVGGVDVISVKAYFVSSRLGEPLILDTTKRVQATITWPTSINPKEAKFSLPSFELVAVDGVGVPSILFRIPRQAESMLVQTDTPAGLPTLLAEFFNTNVVGGPVNFATLDPNANGSIIENGVEFVRFTSTVNMRVTPVFSIWP